MTRAISCTIKIGMFTFVQRGKSLSLRELDATGRTTEFTGQAVYGWRKEKVEHPFGHLKRNLGVQSFLLRGIDGVRAEMSLLATCFNIRRLITLLGMDGFAAMMA